MKENGFTLIELLATVIILCILVLLVTSSLTNVIKSSKEQEKDIIKEKLIDATKEYVNTYDKSIIANFVSVGATACVNSSLLIDAGLIDSSEVSNLASSVSVTITLEASDAMTYTVNYTLCS